MSAEDALRFLARPEWQKEAACNGVGPEWFFWEEFSYDMIKDEYYMTEKAFKRMRKIDVEVIRKEMEKKYKETFCSVCPVREECGDAGRFESYGIWGGLTFEERFEQMTDSERQEFFAMRDGKVK